jgi:hypothetical protein
VGKLPPHDSVGEVSHTREFPGGDCLAISKCYYYANKHEQVYVHIEDERLT